MKVSKETCKLAKSKGYKKCTCNNGYPHCVCEGECWFAEQWEVQEWLRNEHQLYIMLFHDYKDMFDWKPINKWSWEVAGKDCDGYPYTYEEALEEGIKEALLMLKDV